MECGVAAIAVELVGDDVPVPGAHAAGRLQGQLIALLAGAQGLFGAHPLGGLDQDEQHAADPAGRCAVGNGTEREVEIALLDDVAGPAHQHRQIFAVETLGLAAQHQPMRALQIDLCAPGELREALAQPVGVMFPQERGVGVVIDQHQLRTPPQGHGEIGGGDHLDRQLKARGPGVASTQGRGGPVEGPNPRDHVAVRNLIDGPILIADVHFRVPFSRASATAKVHHDPMKAGFQAARRRSGELGQRKGPSPLMGRKKSFISIRCYLLARALGAEKRGGYRMAR